MLLLCLENAYFISLNMCHFYILDETLLIDNFCCNYKPAHQYKHYQTIPTLSRACSEPFSVVSNHVN